jgi:L-aminopeptidase/D-esterase-like protein
LFRRLGDAKALPFRTRAQIGEKARFVFVEMQPCLPLAVKAAGPRLFQAVARPHRGQQIGQFREGFDAGVLHLAINPIFRSGGRDCFASLAMTNLICCHCEEPPGRRKAPSEDKLRDEAISTPEVSMTQTGPRNLITDVPGLLVGQAEDAVAITGTTVVLCEAPATASVDVRGGAPGSRETELLDPAAMVSRIDAIVLSGGSAFGLAAAEGVMEALAAMGRGLPVRDVRVPIVPAAILFDLMFPGRQHWSGEPPHRRLGREALARAGRDFALGNAGAGFGAKAGGLKGGVGSASLHLTDGAVVGALVAVNSWGAVVRPDNGRLWAADQALVGEIPPQPAAASAPLDPEDFSACAPGAAGANTTIAVVATDAPLDKSQCRRLAIMAQDGLAQAIRPAHTPFDGDTVFALSTAPEAVAIADAARIARLGAAAANCLARAIMRAVIAAEPLGGFPSWRQLYGGQ